MRVPLLLCTVLLFAATAFADTQGGDPRVIIDTGGGTFSLTTPNFSFPLAAPFCTGSFDTEWTCVFMNATGLPWDQIHLTISPAQPPLNCQADAFFATCIPDVTGGVNVVFKDGLVNTCGRSVDGIEACGQEFALIFQGFAPDTGIDLHATEVPGVPEPGTIALVGSGAVALLRRRKRIV